MASSTFNPTCADDGSVNEYMYVFFLLAIYCSNDITACISVTFCRPERSWFVFQQRKETFLFSEASIMALEPTLPLTQWVQQTISS